MKQLIKGILVTCAILMTGQVTLAYDAKIDDIYYKFNKNTNTATVTYYSNSTMTSNANAYVGDIVIPPSVSYGGKTYDVTSIGDQAFYYCNKLTSLSIPSSVTSIEGGPFFGCDTFDHVEFASLQHLCSISFKAGASNPLSHAQHLIIDGQAVTDLVIPSDVTAISSYAFYGCMSLNSLVIPASVESIGEDVFANTDIKTIQVASGNAKYDSRNDCNAIIETATNTLLRGTNNTVIPNDVTALGRNAFSGCSMTAFTIPDNIVSYGDYLFAYCTELATFTIPDNMTNIPIGIFQGCTGLTSVTFPNTVTVIGTSAFWGCGKLVSATLPNSLTTIGNSAFNSCTALTSLTIPEKVVKIGVSAFYNCTGLTSLLIPDNVTTVDNHAFGKCSNLTKVILRRGTIGAGAFLDCTNLTTLFVLGTPTFYNVPAANSSHSFYGCNAITQVISFSTKTFTLPDITSGTKRIMLVPASQVKPGGGVVYKPIVKDETTQTTATLTTVSEFSLTAANDVEAENGKVTVTGLRTNHLSSVKVEGGVWGETVYGYLQFQTKPVTATITANATASSILLTGSYGNVESEVQSAGFVDNGENELKLIGLDPQTTSKHTYTITTMDGGVSSTDVEITTKELKLTTHQPKVINVGNVIVGADTNLDDEEENVGFEWRRTDWTDDFESNSGKAYLYEGTMEGYIRNLYAEKLWKYRPYYESSAGNRYYGEWQGIDPTNTSYFEPTVHTYAKASVKGNTAQVEGYVQRGTDNIVRQGFKYWNLSAGARGSISIPSNAMIVEAEGQVMTAQLTGLDYASDYAYVAFVTTSENETFYGEQQTFRTEANTEGVEELRYSPNDIQEMRFDLRGHRLDSPKRGLNIIRMSDGTVKKVMQACLRK